MAANCSSSKRTIGWLATAVISTATLNGGALAADLPAIRKVVMAGTGCPATNGGQAALISNSAAIAIKTPPLTLKSAAATKKLVRQNCEAAITIAHASDTRPIVTSISFLRSSKLPTAARGTVTGSYHLQGAAETPSAALTIDQAGQVSGQRDQLALGDVPGKCGNETTLVVNVAAILIGSTAGDSELIIGDVEVALDWKNCK